MLHCFPLPIDLYHTDLRHPRHIFAVKVGRCVRLSGHGKPREKEQRGLMSSSVLLSSREFDKMTLYLCLLHLLLIISQFGTYPDNITHWPSSRAAICRVCLESVCSGATAFCRIRSYLSTMQKQGHTILSSLVAVFRGSLCLSLGGPE